jgi:Ion channel
MAAPGGGAERPGGGAERPGGGAGRPGDTRGRPRDGLGLVFLLVASAFLLSAFVAGRPGRSLPPLLYVLALLVLMRPSRLPSRAWLLPGYVLVVGAVIGAVATVLTTNRTVRGVVALWLAALLLYAIVLVLWRVLVGQKKVSLDTVLGALAGYLMIGFLFAALLNAVAKLQHAPLFAHGQPATAATIQYFSFVTMATLGYGDFVPAGEPARTLATAEALIGQIFLVTLVARLVSIFGTDRG